MIADVAVLAVLRGARALGRDAASSFDNRKAKNIAGVESARGDLEDVTGAAHRRHLEAFPETPVFAPSAAARAPDELHAADRPRNERVIHIVRNAANVYAELDLTTARAEERVRPGDDADAHASRIKHRHRPDERRHADGQRTDHNHHNRARTARATAIAFASRQQRRLHGRIRRSAARHGKICRKLTRSMSRNASALVGVADVWCCAMVHECPKRTMGQCSDIRRLRHACRLQAQASRTVAELVLHGCQVPGAYEYSHSFRINDAALPIVMRLCLSQPILAGNDVCDFSLTNTCRRVRARRFRARAPQTRRA